MATPMTGGGEGDPGPAAPPGVALLDLDQTGGFEPLVHHVVEAGDRMRGCGLVSSRFSALRRRGAWGRMGVVDEPAIS
jgi:hypothetical protein